MRRRLPALGGVALTLTLTLRRAVVRKLNELYKSSVAACRALSTRLERFFSRKHRLMDQISSITAERLLFSHAVQMVRTPNPPARRPVVTGARVCSGAGGGAG